MVNDSIERIEYFQRSIGSVDKALLLNIGYGMNQNRTTVYNKK